MRGLANYELAGEIAPLPAPAPVPAPANSTSTSVDNGNGTATISFTVRNAADEAIEGLTPHDFELDYVESGPTLKLAYLLDRAWEPGVTSPKRATASIR